MSHLCTTVSLLLVFTAVSLSQSHAKPSAEQMMSRALLDWNEAEFVQAIEAGAAIEGHDRFGTTRLLEAVRRNQYQAAALLIDKGANVDATNVSGDSALCLTVRPKGDAKMAALLLQHGADVNHANKTGQTPLLLAAVDDRADLIVLFTKAGASPDSASPDKYQCTPLGFAAGFGQIDAARALIAAGATIEKPSNGVTSLAGTLNFEHTDVLNLLLQAGANPSQKLSNGKPLVIDCIQHHRRKALAALVAGRADVNAVYDNETPLICALGFDMDCVPILLAAKPDLNQKVKEYFVGHVTVPPGSTPPKHYAERTALMVAVERKKAEVVKMLLAAGANPNITDNAGHTATDLAKQQGSDEIVRLLESSAISSSPP